MFLFFLSKIVVLIQVYNIKLTSITVSFSSEIKRATVYEDLSIVINNSFANTSSFFTSSPCTLVSPTVPNLKKNFSVYNFLDPFFYNSNHK